MAAPTIPPTRLRLIGTGLAVGKLHWPALRGLADRYVVTAFTDRSAEQSWRFADHSGAGPARVAADRAALPACDDVDAVLCVKSTGVDAEQAAAFLALHLMDSDRRTSDLTLNLVFAGGAIGNYTASYPEIPVPPDFADAVQFEVRPVGSVAQSVANATRARYRCGGLWFDRAVRRAASTKRISSSASFAA